MDSTQVVIAAAAVAGVIITLLGAIAGLLVRISIKWARLEGTVESLRSTIRDVELDSQNALKALYDVIRDDRRATNDRLQYLERQRMGQ